MQKVITIRVCESDKEAVEEHLQDYLRQGWKAIHIAAAAAGGSPGYAYAWITVILEKGKA